MILRLPCLWIGRIYIILPYWTFFPQNLLGNYKINNEETPICQFTSDVKKIPQIPPKFSLQFIHNVVFFAHPRVLWEYDDSILVLKNKNESLQHSLNAH